jgi:rod shape-determining protein MreB and related proteins
VIACLGHAPAELAQDVIEHGIHLVGGGSLLRGLDQRLSRVTGVKVNVVNAPLECVVLGAGRCIESYDVLKDLFMRS